MDYTWPQYLSFLRAIGIVERERAKTTLSLGALAAHGSPKALKAAFESFDKD